MEIIDEDELYGLHCDIGRLEQENAKLRELCKRYGEYVSQDRCEGCVYKMRCSSGLIDECWQRGEIRNLARKLGVEVEESDVSAGLRVEDAKCTQ